jgi:hypothetical protein
MATQGHYVYLHKRKTDGKVFYIGKGFGTRAWKKTCRNDWWKRIEAKYGRIVEIYKEGLQEFEAFDIERQLIEKYGRENLCNLRDGGKGGINPSYETRLKMSKARKGIIFSEKHIENMKIARAKYIISDETKKKISKTLTGRPGKKWTEESRIKASNSAKSSGKTPEQIEMIRKIGLLNKGKKGKPLTDYQKEALRLSLEKRMADPIEREKIRQQGIKSGLANKGRKHTEELKKHLSTVHKERNKKFKIPVKCFNGMIFESAGDAVCWLRNNGKTSSVRTNIVSCCNGNLKSAYGFKWEHVNNEI